MQEVQRFNKVLKSLVLLGDLILLNLLLWGFNLLLGTRFWCVHCGSIFQGMTLITLCYLLCNMHSGVILHRPVVRPEQIMIRVLRNMVPFVFFSVCTLLVFHFHFSHSRYFGLFYVALIIVIVSYRLISRHCLELYRKKGGNVRKVVLVGSHENMQELYHAMTDDPTSGYRVVGYFEDFPSDRYPQDVPYLGQPNEVSVFLEKHAGEINQLYCSLPSVRSAEIVPIINYCENHLVRFFSVPNVRNYLKRRMHFELLGNVPVLSIRCEPLESLENRIIKRAFDVVCSGLFLITVFPFVYIFFGIAIKLSSPGPVFFKQKRSGEDGREFWSEVAVAYFPNYQYNCSAVKAFRRIIKEHAVLLNQLTEAGFTPHTTTLTPQQIAIIVRFWGTPALVYEMIKKNSYLAVPKMGKKI